MATGRIGVTPTLGTRWSKAPAGGTTSLSGLDDNSVSLVYSVGYEQVYRNGVLLSRGNDYTATTGNSITLIDATIAGDIIEVFANQLVPLTDAISKGQFTAKGALLSATAASTPAVLTVGSNDQVLTADSTTSTGLKWAAPATGGMTLLTSGTLSGASVSLTSIDGSYKNLILRIYNFRPATDGSQCYLQFNSDTGSNYYSSTATTTSVGSSNQISIVPATDDTTAEGVSDTTIVNYASTSYNKLVENFVSTNNSTTATNQRSQFLIGLWKSTSAITSMQFTTSSGNFTSGNYELYGVK